MTAPVFITSPSLDPLAELNGRTKLLPGYSYKLADGYGLDVAFTDQLDIDEKRMAVWIHYADGNRRDGVGDLLVVEGIDESRHRKNPIHLFDHGKSVTLPIGKTEDPETGRYTGIIDPVTKVAKDLVYYYQGTGLPGIDKGDEYDHALFCCQVFHLLAQKFIRGGSIGYQVLQARELPPEPMYGTPKGLLLLSVLKLESSTVVMPANADTVRKGLAPDLREVLAMPRVCGKPLSPMLVKSLAPYAPEKKAQLGYEGKGRPTTGAASHWGPEEGPSYSYDSGVPVFGKEQPSDDINPEKARQILRDGEANGKPLTDKQRGMFGAAAGEDKALSDDTRREINQFVDSLKEVPQAKLTEALVQAGVPVINHEIGRNAQLNQLRNALLSNPHGNRYPVNRKAAPPAGPNDATVHTRQPYVQAQSASQIPKMSVRQQADGFYVYDPKTGQNQFGPFFSEGIAQRWAERLNMGKKNVKELRKKYRRTAKGLVRRLKRSSPGSSVIYLAGKDLEQARKEAEAKGIKFQHVSSRNGTARVKLIGDDGAIDEVAKSYGRLVKFQGAKSLETQLGKAMGKDPSSMSNTEIIQEAEKLDSVSSKLTDEMISAGRGTEKPTDWRSKTDPLSRKLQENGDRIRALSIEAGSRGFSHVFQMTRGGYRRSKSMKAQQGLGDPFRTNINAATAEAGDVVIARRAIMQTNNVYEYFAQPGERLTIVGVDAGQMRVRNRAGVEQLVISNDVRRKTMGRKALELKPGDRATIPIGMNPRTEVIVEKVERMGDRARVYFRVINRRTGKPSDKVEVRWGEDFSAKSLKGTKSNPLTLIMVGDEVEVIPGSGGHTQYHGGDRGVVKEVRSTGYVIQIPGEPRPTAFEKDEVKLVRKKSMRAKTKASPFSGWDVEANVAFDDGGKNAILLSKPDGTWKAGLYDGNSSGRLEREYVSQDKASAWTHYRALASGKSMGIKSMKHTKKKDGPPQGGVQEDLPAGDESTTAAGEERQLPLGAQVLRRLHEDASLLLQDYDEMLGPLENENVKTRLQGKLEGFSEELTELEEEFVKLYPDLGGLVGTKDDDVLEDAADLESDGEPDNDKEEYEDELEPTPKDMDTMDDNAVGSSSEEREEVSPEDALEGMEAAEEEEEGEKSLRRKVKTLRRKYGKKAMCPECGKEDCICETDEKGIKVAPALVAAAAPVVGGLIGSALAPKDKGYVKEASGFLGEIGLPDSILDDEGRMKSYHYHKTLSGMAQLDEAREDLEEGSEDLQDSGIPPAEFEPGAGAKGVGSAAAAVAKHPRVRAAARGAVRGAIEGAASGKAADERQRTDKPKNPDDGNVRDERGYFGRPGQESTQPAATKPDYQGKGQMEILGQAADFLKELAFLPELDDDYRGRSTEFSKGLNDFVGTDEEAPVEDPNEELPPDEGAPEGAPSDAPEGVVMEEEVPEEEPGMEVKFLADEADLQNKKIAELSRMLSRLPI